MGRARALEVMLSAQDYGAELAERYGWINRALPAKELGDFVSVARPSDRAGSPPPASSRSRTASMRSRSRRSRTSVAIPISLARPRVRPDAQSLFQAAFKRGFQTREGEMDLGRLIGELSDG